MGEMGFFWVTETAYISCAHDEVNFEFQPTNLNSLQTDHWVNSQGGSPVGPCTFLDGTEMWAGLTAWEMFCLKPVYGDESSSENPAGRIFNFLLWYLYFLSVTFQLSLLAFLKTERLPSIQSRSGVRNPRWPWQHFCPAGALSLTGC